MYKKNIEHMLVVGLKYFFDFDFSVCSHVLLMGLVVFGLFKLFLSQAVKMLHEGVVTVKEDAINIKSELADVKERLESSSAAEVMTNIYLSFKALTQTKYQ